MAKLKVYKAVIDNDKQGMAVISFVDSPAVEVDWVAFGKQEKPLEFKVDNEEQRVVRGVVMLADSPIYRNDNGYEYFIEFDKETIRYMAQKYFKDSFQNNVDTNHSFELQEGVYLQEMFIKDVEKGINPVGFESVNDGSLFAQFKVENEDIWKQVKDGTFKGFSLAGVFTVEDAEEYQEYQEVVDLINKIKNKLYK